ncbi:MAG: hypothetical protein AB7S53_14125 [Thiomonas sp.]|jgi:hypothetical protein|uniref:hypothetical protein n=1 Tax=Thiomonas sp. TaxID=2047785 RepID=UPI0005A2FFF8|nr:hypothetical protein [Thiomonas sp.]
MLASAEMRTLARRFCASAGTPARLAYADRADVGALILELAPHDIGWLLPVIRGMALSAPLTMFTSRIAPAHWLRRLRLLLTPEETDPRASSAHCRPRP